MSTKRHSVVPPELTPPYTSAEPASGPMNREFMDTVSYAGFTVGAILFLAMTAFLISFVVGELTFIAASKNAEESKEDEDEEGRL